MFLFVCETVCCCCCCFRAFDSTFEENWGPFVFKFALSLGVFEVRRSTRAKRNNKNFLLSVAPAQRERLFPETRRLNQGSDSYGTECVIIIQNGT